MALLTRATPEQDAKLRALIRGDGTKLAKPKPPKRSTKPATIYVEPMAWLDAVSRVVHVQIALRLDTDQYNANGARWRKAATAEKQVSTVLEALRTQLRGLSANRYERERIRSMVLVRVSPGQLGDDNLISAFKHVRDAACAWLACGDDDFDRKKIGRFDDDVNTPGGLACYYAQTTCPRDKRAHGIQIKFGYSAKLIGG